MFTDRRQIYFATANDKLATLFERKFDFMGEEGFRRFDLWREAPPLYRRSNVLGTVTQMTLGPGARANAKLLNTQLFDGHREQPVTQVRKQ